MLTSGVFGYLADYLLWWLLLISLFVHTWCFFRFFPRKKYRGPRLVLGNALIFMCMLGVVAIAAESYLRFVYIDTDSFGMSLPARRWFAVYTKLNSQGCRDIEWTIEKPEQTRRIAFVGDSFTYGWGIERVEERFTELLAARFVAEWAGPVQVMNVAKPGWGTSGQRPAIQDLIVSYGVDEVVLCYVPNDIERLLPISRDFNPIHPPEPTFFDPDSSCLLDYLYRTLWIPRVATVSGYHDWLAEGFAREDIWRQHQGQLGDVIGYCRDREVTFRVVLLPFIRTSGTKFEPQTLHSHLQRFFEANGVDVLDLLPTIKDLDPAGLMVNGHDAHPNEWAHQLYAEAIWKAFYASPEG